ncbi:MULTISPECIES: aspartyl protease family protein [Aquimarina]|uniref:PDZ domain-containing protein n=1 Tax=Aquimarina algiphila TaxID=2047982 RepID=A0A554VGE7_9FLAO|nr:MULTISPECIES: aspartyl protease family protein [Aquimarina]TSE06453.1 PDZ domain-containing protein [Aquimarina algiphila]
MKILSLNFCHFLKSKVLVVLLLLNVVLFAQKDFRLPVGKKHNKLRFELANNLIIVPVVVNGVELSFILDTGVGSTIIFSVDNKSSLELKDASKIYLRGLGDNEPVEAIKSINNEVKIGKATSRNHKIYLVLDETINFSPRMGFPIHGIIGYDLFKDFVVEINYSKRVIKINKPETYAYKKCEKCYKTKIKFRNNRKRPFVTAKYKSDKGLIDVNLLLDSGSGSSLWLFENEENGIHVGGNSFRDFLGKGFNGDIYGQKTKIKELRLGDFMMKEVTASFPDSIYIQGISQNDRQGSLGGNILRRFNLIVDYPGEKISFKKNGYFGKPFNYNMSGLTIQHSGFTAIKGYKENNTVHLGLNEVVTKKTLELSNDFVLLPRYEISDVRINSPANLAGLQKGDIILEVNGKKAFNYKLSDLNELFYFEEGRKITMKIERLGVEIKYHFYLKKVI